MEYNEKLKIYDELIGTTYANMFSLSKGKDIVLKGFDFKCPTCRVFLEVAQMVAYMTNKEIYLQGSWIDAMRTRLMKKNKHIHHIGARRSLDGINIHEVACFECEAMGLDKSIFEEVFKAYYEGKGIIV